MKIELMHNTSGMTFLEVMIVLVLIGIMGAVVAPNLFYYFRKQTKLEIEIRFQELIHQIKQDALLTGKVQQVFFDFQKKKVFAKRYDDSQDDVNKHNRFAFSSIQPLDLGEDFSLQNFFIQGKDEVRFGENKETAWFYIMPDGSSQDIIINFTYGDEGKERGIKINPFYVRVFLYDSFQYP